MKSRVKTSCIACLAIVVSLASSACMPAGTWDCSYFFRDRDTRAPLTIATFVEVNAETLDSALTKGRQEADKVKTLDTRFANAEIVINCTLRPDQKVAEGGPVRTGTYYDRRTGLKIAYTIPAGSGGLFGALASGAAALGVGQQPGTAVSAPSSLATSFVVEADLTKGTQGFEPAFGAGLRAQRPINPRVNVFGQFTAGVTRFPDGSAFTLKPSGGVLIPLTNQPFSIYGSVGVPFMHSFGSFERGFEISGGISMPVGK